MPVRAMRFIRKMRGGAQAHLLEADDGHCYVVKFKNNPQHRRILVNEWIASVFLRYLQITAPEAAIVELDQEFLASAPEVYLQLGSHRAPVETGWHFGSRFPGDPARTAVFDFLPDVLLPKVANPGDFLGVFLFDKWMANADSRQSIFYRAQIRRPEEESANREHTGAPRFVAVMVDHGFVFDGPNWHFGDSPLQGLYHRSGVYRDVTGWDDFQPWLDRIRYFPEEVLDQAYKQIPREWLSGDREQLEALLTRLLKRRSRVEALVEDCRAGGRVNPFPNWR